MAESAESPSVAGTESNQTRTPAPKDKHCPFCDQLFTSSSLGRHLDLYIKDKNPKPADGVHDIEKIREMRSNITRRSARTSSVKRESVTPAHSKASPTQSQHSPIDGDGSTTVTAAAAAIPPPALYHPDSPARASIRPGSEASPITGLLRDLTSSSNDHHLSSRLDGRRDSVRKVKTGIEHKEKMRDVWDQGRAAELALREVLDSVRVATVRARSRPPLPFDVFALTFPAMVLHCLAAPPTLYSTQPFPTVNSWSLDPPGEMQCQALVAYLREQSRNWQSELARPEPRAGRHESIVAGRRLRDSINAEGLRHAMMSAGTAQEQEERVIKHAQDAYAHWNLQSDLQKYDGWRLEILRAYSREKEKRQELEARLEEALQDVAHCRAQVDRLSRCQQPREFILNPPSPMPISSETVKELSAASTAHQDWEYDRLLSKWKGVVQDHRRSVSGMAGQRPLAPSALPSDGGFHFRDHRSRESHSHHGPHPPPTHGSAGMMTNGSSSMAPSPLNGEVGVGADDPMEDVSPGPGEEASSHVRTPTTTNSTTSNATTGASANIAPTAMTAGGRGSVAVEPGQQQQQQQRHHHHHHPVASLPPPASLSQGLQTSPDSAMAIDLNSHHGPLKHHHHHAHQPQHPPQLQGQAHHQQQHPARSNWSTINPGGNIPNHLSASVDKFYARGGGVGIPPIQAAAPPQEAHAYAAATTTGYRPSSGEGH